MHVLAATNNLFPEPSATGSGRYNHEVGRRLVERDHRVSVVTRRRDGAPERETVAGMDVYRYEASVPRLPATLRAIRRHVESIGSDDPVDVASFHGALSSLGVDRALADRVPRTYTVHGLWATEYRERVDDDRFALAPWHRLNAELRDRVEGRTLARSDRAVVLSGFMRDRVEAAHPDAPHVSVVPGGVDTDRFSPDAADATEAADVAGAADATDATAEGSDDDAGASGGDDGAVEFLTVRRLTPRMGLDTLVDAFAAVAGGGRAVRLRVGGDGPLRSDLEAHARRLNVAEAVRFLGYVPEERLAGLYADADVFVLPTVAFEGFGLVTLEALASGTPVVGTRVGATPEILGGLERDPAVPAPVLIPPGDADALAAAMADWAALSADERAAAGAACRRYVVDEGYSWERVADRLERLLAELV